MTMSGYYDHFPTVSLQKPIVVSGMIPSESRQLAHRVACLHGLRFTDFNAAVEHSAGRSLAELRDVFSAQALGRTEARVLKELLCDEPFGIVALPDRVLSMRSVKKRVEKTSTFVVLNYSARDCYHRSRQSYRAEAPMWILDAPGPEALESLYRQWTRRFQKARISLPMEGATWVEASKSLVRQLEESSWLPS